MRVSSLPKLNIGAGRSPLPKEEGWINCDLYHGEGVDLAFDCQGPWPFENESVMEVRSDHTVEHLSDPMAFFREAWRVLIPNGQLNLRLPYGWHQSSWWDLTHLRPWLQESFATVQPGFTQFTRNHQHDHLSCAFWVNNVIMILEKSWARMFRFWPLRPIVKWGARHLLNVIKDLRVEAFKRRWTILGARHTAGIFTPPSCRVVGGCWSTSITGGASRDSRFTRCSSFVRGTRLLRGVRNDGMYNHIPFPRPVFTIRRIILRSVYENTGDYW